MNLNMQILTYNMTQYQIEPHLTADTSLSLCGARPFPPREEDLEHQERYVYVASASSVTPGDISILKNIILVLKPTDKDGAQYKKLCAEDQNLILVFPPAQPRDVLCAVSEIFEFYCEQMAKLLYAVAENRSLAHCLNIACHLFHDPMFMLDTASTLVAYTTEDGGGMDLREEIWPSILANGHISLNAMNYYEKANEPISNMLKRHAFFHTIDPTLYHSIRINIFIDDVRVGRILIADDYAPLGEGYLAIADYISPLISTIIRKQDEIRNLRQTELEQFVCRQLDGFQYKNLSIVRKHLSGLHWDINGNYHLIRIIDQDEGLNDVSTFTMRNIRSLFPSCIMTIYKDCAVFLINSASCEPPLSAQEEQLLELGKAHDLKIGVSMRFSKITAMKAQYELVSATMEVGMRLAPKEIIYLYQDLADLVWLHLLQKGSTGIQVGDICCEEIRILHDYDKKYHTSLVESLMVYLLSERSLLKASERLHLHRNSLVYRLDKINSIVDLDLSDPLYRRYLLASCYALCYMEGGLPLGLMRSKGQSSGEEKHYK